MDIFAYMCRNSESDSDNKVSQRWIICAYTQIPSRDVEAFCVHAQKFLIVILDKKSSTEGLFAQIILYIVITTS